MPTSEKINTAPKNETHDLPQSPEAEAAFQSDTLRHSLLAGSEGAGNFAIIPRNTVMVEANSTTIQQESFSGLSHLALEAGEEKGQSSQSIRSRGYGKLGMSNMMSSLDMNVRHRLNKDELSPNMTLLYDGQHLDVDGETQIPSAVLVHEELSDLQIEELRNKLPAGVPLIDGKTNRLLDEVGQAEREQGRQNVSNRRNLGSFAIHGFGKYDRMRTERIMDDPIGGFDWSNYYSKVARDTDQYEPHTPQADGFYSEPQSEPREGIKTTSVPESDEVRTYREKMTREAAEKDAYKEYEERNVKKAAGEIKTVAKNLYETSDVSSLDSAQLARVERKVQSTLHPDRGFESGGDSGAFKEAGVIMRELKKDAETRQPSESE